MHLVTLDSFLTTKNKNRMEIYHVITRRTKHGLKFGNNLSGRHIEYFRNKVNVKIACQTFSSSVADAIEFMMLAGHSFKNAEGTIEFIRIIDRLFDLLNVRNLYAKVLNNC